MTLSQDGNLALLTVDLSMAPPWYRDRQVPVLVDVDRGRLLTAPGADDEETASALSPDGTAVAVGHVDGSVDIRPIASTGAGEAVTVTLAGEAMVEALAWTADSRLLLVGSDDGLLQAVDREGRLLWSRTGHGGRVVLLSGGRAGGMVLSLDHQGIALVRDGAVPGPLGAAAEVPRPHSVAAAPSGSPIAFGLEGGEVRLLQGPDLQPGPTFHIGPPGDGPLGAAPEIRQRVTALAFTPDGRRLVAGDRTGQLRMWSVASGETLWSRSDVPTAWLAFSPDGRYLATAEFTHNADDPAPDSFAASSQVRIWDRTGRVVAQYDTNARKPRSIAFSPDSRHLVLGFFEPQLDVLAVPSGRRQARLPLSGNAVGFTPDGSELLVVDMVGVARVVDTGTWAVERQFATGVDSYAHVAYSHDGRFLFVADWSKTAIWSGDTYRLLVPSVGPRGDATNDAIFLSVPSRREELVLATQGTVARVVLRQPAWERTACALAARQLTPQEWRRYLPTSPYDPACPPG
jgi:WD40 repeat protein